MMETQIRIYVLALEFLVQLALLPLQLDLALVLLVLGLLVPSLFIFAFCRPNRG